MEKNSEKRNTKGGGGKNEGKVLDIESVSSLVPYSVQARGDGEILVRICCALCVQAYQREVRERKLDYCYTLPDCESISAQLEETEKFWWTFFVHCVIKLTKERSEKENQATVTLCQIVRAFQLNIVEFLKEVPQFCLKAGHILACLYGSDWQKKFEVLYKFLLSASHSWNASD